MERIYGSNQWHNKPSHRLMRGRKKKSRRKARAWAADGWERKQAGGLTPQTKTSKQQWRTEQCHE